MLAQRRSPGTVGAPPEILAVLARLRAAEAVTAAAELDIDQLCDVEAAIGMRFGDDLLAAFAAHVPSLEERRQLRLGLVLGHTGALRQRGARGDLVGVAAEPDGVFVCLQKREAPGLHTELILFDPETRTRAPVPLADWLTQRLPAAAPTSAPFSPRLVGRVPESTASGARVRHKTFGEGRVLSESGDGPQRKVKVDFPGHGLKLLQARFLEFLD